MLHEFIGQENKDCPCSLVKTASQDMVADIHTKGFPNADDWDHAHSIANVVYIKNFQNHFNKHQEYFREQALVEKSRTSLMSSTFLWYNCFASKLSHALTYLPLTSCARRPAESWCERNSSGIGVV